VLAKGRQFRVYAYLFAKKDRASIDADKLASFRVLAAIHAQKTDDDLNRELQLKELMQICE